MIRIGFWDETTQPMVSKTAYLDGFIERIKEWSTSLKTFHNVFIQELENGYIGQYMGYAECCICHLNNGDSEISYGNYTFPVGYLHYIIDHNIDAPIQFQQFVMESAVPKIVDKSKEKRQEEHRQHVLRLLNGMGGLVYS